MKSFNYNRSERKALANGFEEVANENAYNGRYFIRNNLCWIHNISALKTKLRINTNEELLSAGYDVFVYYA